MHYAPKGSRIAAYLLDSLILFLFQIVLTLIYAAVIVAYARSIAPQINRYRYNYESLLAPTIGSFIVYLLVSVIIFLLYYSCFESSSKMATPGKRAFCLVVVDDNQQRITFPRALFRNMAKVFSGFFFIGYIIGLLSENGKTLHDILCRTYVLKAPQTVSHAVEPAPAVRATETPTERKTLNPMHPRLVCVSGVLAGKVYDFPSSELTIGKDPAACRVVVPMPSVSRSHCQVYFNPMSRTFLLKDLGSTNGTFLPNGTRLRRDFPYALNSGDEFCIVERNQVFRVEL